MKKRVCILLTAVLLCALFPADCVAAEPMSAVRVGLTSRFAAGTSQLSFSDRTLSMGYEFNGMFYNMLTLDSASGFVAAPSNSYFITGSESSSDYNTISSRVFDYRSYGIPAVACLSSPGVFTVCAGPYSSQEGALADAARITGASVANSGRMIVLYDGISPVAVFNNQSAYPQFQGQGGFTTIAGRKYRGRVECGRYSGNGIDVINVVDMQGYLYSAVPSEMPSSWHIEAIKAQAVAARSFTSTKKNYHSANGYDVCDSVHCQVYLGASNEAASAISAVDATNNIYAYYAGEPINAVFSASSGGYTENSENAWSQALPYLRAVSDVYETTAKLWSRSFTLSDISALLTANGVSIGAATGVAITEASASGRVQRLEIYGTAGTHVLTKEDIRNFFAKHSEGALESRVFSITNGTSSSAVVPYRIQGQGYSVEVQLSGLSVVSASGSSVVVGSGGLSAVSASGTSALTQEAGTSVSVGNVIQISGRGYGHGVGLSQHGANGMAAAGFTYDQILKHYYTGIEVR